MKKQETAIRSWEVGYPTTHDKGCVKEERLICLYEQSGREKDKKDKKEEKPWSLCKLLTGLSHGGNDGGDSEQN
jgi:hypothetical protein